MADSGRSSKTRHRQEAAETLALQGLAFIAASDIEVARFVDASGMQAAELRQRADEPAVLRAVLDFLLADDERLMGFCNSAEVDPRDVHMARHVLDCGS
jgi:hypothetical protein